MYYYMLPVIFNFEWSELTIFYFILFYFQVLGYPSKPIGLFIRRSIIFRSDSNGEDLEGYAGAGLYDRSV